jgi:hypothetical protein
METRPAPEPWDACDEARSLVSPALDGALDDVGRHFLDRHVRDCVACAQFAADVGAVRSLLRGAPLEPFHSGFVPGRRVMGKAARAHRAHWATTAAAVVAIGIGVASLPQAETTPAPLPRVVAAVDVPAGGPVKLPIGQRSAESDFAAGYHALEA